MFGKRTVKTDKIFRVKKRNSRETNKRKNNNILLFHGTDIDSAVGILEGGFKPSTEGKFGPGVYLTASSNVAASYSVAKSRQQQNKLFRMFVNEVLESKKLNLVKF